MAVPSIALVALLAGAEDDPLAAVTLEVAWPGLPEFERPIELHELPRAEGGARCFLLGEQDGSLFRFDVGADGAATEPREVATHEVSRLGNEEGLIGLALHPDFDENGRLIVHRSLKRDRRGRVSEFRFADDGLVEGSERVLLEVDQPWRNHNGGQLAFGPDGFLYVGLGDGGSAGDPHQNGQDPSTLLGAILRIDVDARDPGLPYAVPDDNPFAGHDRYRGEVWAYGLRNPWRFSFDPATGLLWCGDVGQNRWEEVCVVRRGENHGWRLFEGFAEYAPDSPVEGPEPPVEPVLAYPRSDGWSITGGFVYRGESVPALVGRYVYADYVTGRVWSVVAEPDAPGEPFEHAKVREPASFAVDAEGELYVLAFDGRLYRFVERAPQ